MIELMVVIVILGIMVNFGMPRIYNASKDNVKDVSRKFINKVLDLKIQAVREQKSLELIIDFENNSLNSFKLPEDVYLMDLQRPDGEKESTDKSIVRFFKNGFSDYVAIHLENDDGEQTTLVVEPFLEKVRLYNEYKELGD